ncbi:U-box domain-containing protein 34 isoform X1 [Rhododendron vialii]|uniref:U-box domain-containing protein 34 isoform X1 n=1 Tax=Rhododendron vialii TaxID=182163 RepID=UPI00265E768B|nr:U-box domain-containing protein 34 isoform X1 [Rhododendron vialii]
MSSVDSDRTLPPPLTVAVAVKGGGGGRGGKASRRAVRWAAEKLFPVADRFVLIHVMPKITSIPTPSGDTIPIEQLDAHVAEMYMEDTKLAFQKVFIPFKKLCKRKKVETLLLEGDNPASALLKYVTDSGVRSLVLGSCSSSFIRRILWKRKDSTVPSVVLKNAAEGSIYIVSRRRVITTSATPLSTGENISRSWWCSRIKRGSHIYKLNGGHYSSSVDGGVTDTASYVSDLSHLGSIANTEQRYPNHSGSLPERNDQHLGNSILDIEAATECSSVASANTKQSDVQAEVEKLRLELMDTVGMYNRACEDLVNARNKVQFLSYECLEETRQVNAAKQREEAYKKMAAEENRKYLETMKEIEMARNKLAKEAYERQIAELKALKESMEKKKIVDALFSNDRRYKRYTRDEIEIATESFSETKMIGEGSYGKVYRCNLDKIPVAIKVLRSDAAEKKEEFLTEIEVFSQLRHPHIVLLLGACPETGCLVYEYMENGSLEDILSHQSSRDPLPWFVRFRIAFEVACGLAFLHNSKPNPVIHRDLKPGNIFLDRNYVSKIGDVGLAKLVSDVAPDSITEYGDSGIAGTLYYLDPEYQRTGTVRPKSDLYAFGIIVLQLLSARHPNGLLLKFENALSNDLLLDILDKSIPDWPLAEAEELTQMALKCSRLRCRDRPDLETEVLPLLKKLADMADAALRVQRNSIHAPNHYFCPILQEVMEDPYIAADGFTYEHRAIKLWVERHSLSPVTKLKLQHKVLIQNHTLRSAIQDWRSRITSSPGQEMSKGQSAKFTNGRLLE